MGFLGLPDHYAASMKTSQSANWLQMGASNMAVRECERRRERERDRAREGEREREREC